MVTNSRVTVFFFFEQPTQYPTKYCPSFVVGYEACNSSLVDLLYIMDSSNSITPQEFDDFKEVVARRFEESMPEGARVALMQYSDQILIPLNFDDGSTNAEIAKEIRDMQLIGGATYTRRAIETGWDEVWEPSLPNNRTRITFLVTDGQPSLGQDPCDPYSLTNYDDSGKFF